MEKNCYKGSRQPSDVNLGNSEVCLYYSLDYLQPGDKCRANYERVYSSRGWTCRWASLGPDQPAWYTLHKALDDEQPEEPEQPERPGTGDARAPTVRKTLEDITLQLEVGRPFRWGSEDLDDYFSDPDGDRLTYTVSSSNTSVAVVVISEPGPILIVQAQSGGSATITVTARDPDGRTSTQRFTVTVNETGRAGQ